MYNVNLLSNFLLSTTSKPSSVSMYTNLYFDESKNSFAASRLSSAVVASLVSSIENSSHAAY